MFSGIKTKLFSAFKKYYPIWIILVLAFAVRWYGIYFDYPQTNFIWDETYDMAYLMNMFDQRSFFINSFASSYPLVLPFIYAPVVILRMAYLALAHGLYSIETFKNYIIESGIGQIYIVSRWYAVFAGVATVWLIYKIYGLIFKSRLSAHYAALVYSFSLVPVFLSHWGKHHSVMALFFILSLYFILKFEQTKQSKYFYCSAIAATLSLSTHYIGVSAIIFPLWGLIQNRRIIDYKIILKSGLICLLIAALFYLPNYAGIKWMFTEMNQNYYAKNGYQGIVPTGAAERFYYLFRDTFKIEPIFLTLFVIFLLAKFKEYSKNPMIRYILAGLAFNYLLMTTIIVGPRMTRWLLPFVTLAIPLAAASLAEFLRIKPWNRKIILFLMLLLVLPSAFFSQRWLRILNANTSLETEQWLISNVKADEDVYSFNDYLNLPLSYRAALWNKENNNMDNLKKNNYILEHKDYFEGRGINLMYDKTRQRYKDLAGDKTKYIVITYGQADEPGPIRANLKKYHQLELKQSFQPTADSRLFKKGIGEYLNNPESWLDLLKLEKSGPYVEIYQVIK